MENNNCKEEISFENLLLQSEGERYDYPAIFTDDCGLDIKFPEKGTHAVKTWGYTKRNQRRRATLKIDSYIGVCAEAMHYYGEIEIQGVDMEYDDNHTMSTMSNDEKYPLSHFVYTLVLRRPITEHEIQNDPLRWGDYYLPGDLTNCFNSVEEIVSLAKKVFKFRFLGDWEFEIISYVPGMHGMIEI